MLATVPHVTVAPVAKGVNPDAPGAEVAPGSRHCPTTPWIVEADFRPAKHRSLTHPQARAIDSAIDQYDDTIAEAVRHARTEDRDWYLFDMCSVLDGLAQRRYVNDDVDYRGLRRADTLDANPPALMDTAWNIVTPFLTRLVSRRRTGR